MYVIYLKNTFNPHLRICLLFWEEERERNIDVREILVGCLLYTPHPGIEPTT